MQIELTHEEVEVLKQLLEREIGGINPEIHRTGTAAMRDELKQYREVLRRIHAQLSGEPQA